MSDQEEPEVVDVQDELHPGEEAVIVNDVETPDRPTDQEIYDTQKAEKETANEERQERLGHNVPQNVDPPAEDSQPQEEAQ